jgi:hypothetical protein
LTMPGWCCECEDTPAAVCCAGCGDEVFCRPCWGAQHRRGKRVQHTITAIALDLLPQPKAREGLQQGVQISSYDDASKTNSFRDSDAPALDGKTEPEPEAEGDQPPIARQKASALDGQLTLKRLEERCMFIPVRLSADERDLLSYLEGTLHVSEYTDNVDVLSRYNVTQRILAGMEDFCAMHTGLVCCKSFKKGSRLVAGSFEDNASIFQLAFEVGRRYKIMNPQKMRSNYGKLMYMLQDWATPGVARAMGFSAARPILTVHSLLGEYGALGLLRSQHLPAATADPSLLSAAESAAAVEAKGIAIKAICEEHASDSLSVDVIQRCLESIADSNNYLNMNAAMVERMLGQLTTNFDPSQIEDRFSLELRGSGSSGRSNNMYSRYSYGFERAMKGGAKLSHSHGTQYTFVLQTLSLWHEISLRMYKLWLCSDLDLLSTRSSYRLCNTGQVSGSGILLSLL